MDTEVKKQDRLSRTKNRRPFATKEPNLPLPTINGCVVRWFNDEENRLFRAQDAGWEFVTPSEFPSFRPSQQVAPNSDMGSRISVISGTDDMGKSVRSYLMKIEKEFWDEDQAAKQKDIDETDKAIHGGRVSPYSGSYVKSITIS